MALSPLQLVSNFKAKSMATEGRHLPTASTASRLKKYLLLGSILGGVVFGLYGLIRYLPRAMVRSLTFAPQVSAAAPANRSSGGPTSQPMVAYEADVSIQWILGESAGVRSLGRDYVVAAGDSVPGVGPVLRVGVPSVVVLGRAGLRTYEIGRLARGAGDGGARFGAPQRGSGVPQGQGLRSWLSDRGYAR